MESNAAVTLHFDNVAVCNYLLLKYPNDSHKVIPPGNIELLSGLNELGLCGLFFN